ncbi:hypothetical protein H311_03651, partial [Anncaliia algerae PRA109]
LINIIYYFKKSKNLGAEFWGYYPLIFHINFVYRIKNNLYLNILISKKKNLNIKIFVCERQLNNLCSYFIVKLRRMKKNFEFVRHKISSLVTLSLWLIIKTAFMIVSICLKINPKGKYTN